MIFLFSSLKPNFFDVKMVIISSFAWTHLLYIYLADIPVLPNALKSGLI